MQSPASVCFHSNFWTDWPLILTFCMCTGHDHSSHKLHQTRIRAGFITARCIHIRLGSGCNCANLNWFGRNWDQCGMMTAGMSYNFGRNRPKRCQSVFCFIVSCFSNKTGPSHGYSVPKFAAKFGDLHGFWDMLADRQTYRLFAILRTHIGAEVARGGCCLILPCYTPKETFNQPNRHTNSHIDLHTHDSSASDNRVTLTLDLSILKSTHSEQLPCTVCLPSLVLIAQVVFLYGALTHTDTQTHG